MSRQEFKLFREATISALRDKQFDKFRLKILLTYIGVESYEFKRTTRLHQKTEGFKLRKRNRE